MSWFAGYAAYDICHTQRLDLPKIYDTVAPNCNLKNYPVSAMSGSQIIMAAFPVPGGRTVCLRSESRGTGSRRNHFRCGRCRGETYIEETLNLANNADLTWTYSADADAWGEAVSGSLVIDLIQLAAR